MLTKQLLNMVENGECYFLSRPRRFGKSLIVMVTGVSKFSKVGLLSGVNNLNDISMDEISIKFLLKK